MKYLFLLIVKQPIFKDESEKISLFFMFSLFVLFLNINGYAKENIPQSVSILASSRHSPYISYDISREAAGIGYRYQSNLFMYDFNGTYKFLNPFLESWPSYESIFSSSFHC